ncbi:MAG: SEC-C metal-binding domain-containing protein [Acidimicrobiales bacterium]
MQLAEHGDDPSAVDTAYEYLIAFLTEQPRHGDAVEACREERAAWQGRTGWVSATLVPSTTVRKTKIGRNKPCPCASGRKYKYCCGR